MQTFDVVAHHFRFAARSLARRPILTVVALATLALGIGANTAIFSIIDGVLLKPLPFRDPERLVMVWGTAPNQGIAEGFSSYPDFDDWRRQAKSFDGLAAFWTFPNGDVNLTGGSEPQRVSVARITPGFFEVLGVQPLHGREFQDEESIVGNHRRAILSYGLWANVFGADSTLVGKSVLVNGFPYTVVGIMPKDVAARSVKVLGTDVQLWRPLVPEDNQTGGRDSRKLHVIGRLASGTTTGQAESELSAIASRLSEAYPESNRDTGIHLVPLREQVVRDVRRGLVFLFSAVAVVLLGACANVANLLLIKASSTRKQRAVQYAIGASRFRIGAQVLFESVLLGIGGAVLGVVLANWVVRGFIAIGPAEIPLLADVRIDRTVLLYAIGSTFLTVVLVGLLPAWRTSRPEFSSVLRQGGSRVRGTDDRRLMRTLSVFQIALAMVLLTTGGLLMRSFQALLNVNTGITTQGILTFQLELPMGSGMPYSAQPARDAFFATLLQRLNGMPSVQSTTIANAPPLEEDPASLFSFTVPSQGDNRELRATRRLVAPDYFKLLGIPVLGGRSFESTDLRAGPRVVVVSSALARSVWGTSNPIGQRITTSSGESAEVIGVVGDVRTGGLDAELSRVAYVPTSQAAFNFMTVLVRSQTDPGELAGSIRGVVNDLDAALPLHRVRTVQSLVADSVAQQRFQALLIGSFALLMCALAVLGTYGVTAYGVSERTNELGVRAALGATRGNLRALVMREGTRLALAGIVLGALTTLSLGGMLTRFLFGVSRFDIVTFVVAPLLLALAALLATFIPAHRAAKVDPNVALRSG